MSVDNQLDPFGDLGVKLQYSFVDGDGKRDESGQAPRLVTNVWEKGEKVLTAIEDELRQCSSFDLSVAFMTRGGIEPLLAELMELDARGVKGRILTTDYLCFTEPSALEPLLTLRNLQVRMYRCAGAVGFHTKGYLFSQSDDTMRIIVGSSNITSNALTLNHEWNVSLVCAKGGAMAGQFRRRFEDLWSLGKDVKSVLPAYREEYEKAKAVRAGAVEAAVRERDSRRIEPNSMQAQFINALKNLISSGESRALLISATGTGKTYAAALAMRELGARSVLFLVHREQIAKKSLESFNRVLGDSATYGFMGGAQKDAGCADYVFGTVQTISKDDNLRSFEQDRFEYVIIDEAHHSEAASYKKIISWFKPKMLLGMTATPERTKNSKDSEDVFTLFNHNVALEIRLQDAIEENLICPFHYFGVCDISVDGKPLDEESDFSRLTCDERVKHILDVARYYGFSGSRVRGLMFCRSLMEARDLSKKFNLAGLRTIALSGSDSQEARLDAVRRLESDGDDALDYILTQEIFNEGIDIPCVNQVILLRPTQSPIVFVQQLGRGLRRNEGKEFTVVLDFIANYRNNFMVPLALSGDRSWDKDSYRRYVAEGSKVIKGPSTIHFDEISRKRIYASIDTANFSSLANIKKNYQNLKDRLGRIPTISDYDKLSGMDVLRLFDNPQLRSYHTFLRKYEPDYPDKDALNADEELAVQFISCRFAPGKRPHELLMLRGMLEGCGDLIAYVREHLSQDYGLCDPAILNPVQLGNIMEGRFEEGQGSAFNKCVLAGQGRDGKLCASRSMKEMLCNQAFRSQVDALVSFGLSRYERDYKDRYGSTMLSIGRSYSYRDVARLLNWDTAPVAQNIGGYAYNEKTRTLPVFINYVKDESIDESINYADRFISPSELISMSKNKRTTKSPDVRRMIDSKENGVSVELFMRKSTSGNGDEGKNFYFLGDMSYVSSKNATDAKGNSIVELAWKLDRPVERSMYDYMTTSD